VQQGTCGGQSTADDDTRGEAPTLGAREAARRLRRQGTSAIHLPHRIMHSSRSRTRVASFAVVFVPVALLSACATDDGAARRDSIVAASEEAYTASHRASAPPDTTDSTVRGPAPMTDNNILARVAQDDRLEVQVAGLAIAKITSPALKDFARQIRDNHSAGENDARKLSQSLKVPEQAAATDTTKQHQQNLVTQFTKLSKGTAFDTMYVRHLVDGHSAMLRELKVMEAKASHAEVKRLLVNAEPEVQRHLNRAREIGRALAPAKKPAA
jgi:putative membrane protein